MIDFESFKSSTHYLRYQVAWDQWVKALNERNWGRADFWRSQLVRFREDVD